METAEHDWTPQHTAQAIGLRGEGETYARIADALGYPLATVYSHLMQASGRKPKPRKPRTGGRKRKTTRRDCLCCKNSFPSAGPHNRLCKRCRHIDISPFAI